MITPEAVERLLIAAELQRGNITQTQIAQFAATLRALSARVVELEGQMATVVQRTRNNALREAADLCWSQVKRRNEQAATASLGVQRDRWIAGKVQAESLAQEITALIKGAAP